MHTLTMYGNAYSDHVAMLSELSFAVHLYSV